MKIVLSFLLCICAGTHSFTQNTGINTDGSTPETGVMLDIKGTNSKTTTTALQNIFQIKSFDASTDALKLTLGLATNSTTPSNQYGLIEVPEYSGGSVSAYRHLAMQPLGGNVGIGTTTPIAKLEVIANSTNTNSTYLGLHFGGTQSTANSANYTGLVIDPIYSATGTLGNMVSLGVNNQNSSTGTITTMHGIVSLPDNSAGGSITNMFGYYSQPLNSAGGSITTMTGYAAVPRNMGAGTIGNMHGAYLNPANTGAGTVTTLMGAHIVPQKTGTGTVTNMYGVRVQLENTNASGAITTGYGIFISDPTTTGAITNKYALVTGSNAGNVGFGTVTPTSPVHIIGAQPGGSFVTKIQNTTFDGEILAGINDLGNEAISWRTDAAGGFLAVCTTAGTRSTSIGPLGSYFGGTVAIGTTSVSPGASLEVAGQVKITGGTPGAGKVLTSDAVGLASWTNGTTSSGSGFMKLLYNDESTASGTSTATSVKTYTVSGSYTQVKVEVDIEADCQTGGGVAPGWTYAILYNGVTVRTAKITGPSASANWSTGSFSYTGAINNGDVISVDIPSKFGSNAATTYYVRNFRVYAIY